MFICSYNLSSYRNSSARLFSTIIAREAHVKIKREPVMRHSGYGNSEFEAARDFAWESDEDYIGA
jgi:hypothetical protein